MSLQIAINKLCKGWTLETLPINDSNNPLWAEIRADCNLTGPEIALLQNEIAQRSGMLWH